MSDDSKDHCPEIHQFCVLKNDKAYNMDTLLIPPSFL